jgi:hypothetical protein
MLKVTPKLPVIPMTLKERLAPRKYNNTYGVTENHPIPDPFQLIPPPIDAMGMR